MIERIVTGITAIWMPLLGWAAIAHQRALGFGFDFAAVCYAVVSLVATIQLGRMWWRLYREVPAPPPSRE